MTKLAPAQLAVIQLRAARYFTDLFIKPKCSERRRREIQRWADENPRHRQALVFHLRMWSFIRRYPEH